MSDPRSGLRRPWFRDTLFLRLFVLMWVALVGSHLVAFELVTGGLLGIRDGSKGAGPPMPTFPSLPPTGFESKGERPPPPRDGAKGPPPDMKRPPDMKTAPDMKAPPDMKPPPDKRGPPGPAGAAPGLPLDRLLLDYGVRLLLIGVAAWFGARWLSQPMRRLADAAGELRHGLGSGKPPPRLDETRGTLEVRETACVFNAMSAQLAEQFRSRELLMAALSHDLKTPLTRVRMQLESLSDRPEALRSIEDVREMNTLIDRTLELFRDAQATEALQDTDVHALAAALVDDLAERGEAVQLHGSRAIARAQPVALRRVLGNLIGNAIRYASAAEVTVAQDQLTVTVRVEDRGPGIAPEHLERVFEPFFRVESSRSRASGGTGLGLYIARDLTLRQGGTLTLANRAGGGLCATVTLARSEVTRLH